MSKKYKINSRQKSSDSYFDSCTDYYWDIVRMEDEKVILRFNGSWYEGTWGREREGVESIDFHSDDVLKIKYFDKPGYKKWYIVEKPIRKPYIKRSKFTDIIIKHGDNSEQKKL